MKFVYNDGGRADAGFRGDVSDCVTRAVAIATGVPYKTVYDAINLAAKSERLTAGRVRRSSARNGVRRNVFDKYIKSLGWSWVPTMGVGSGCRVHLRDGDLPMGRLIVRVSGHMVAVIDGVIHDTSNPDRDGTRCVYGYYVKNA